MSFPTPQHDPSHPSGSVDPSGSVHPSTSDSLTSDSSTSDPLTPFDAADLPSPAPYPEVGCAPWVEPSYSTWDVATHGPTPRPEWVITELAALDTELGVLKTGKEADVHLVSRTAPDGRESLLAAKRFRTADHRMFHRDAGYQEGRRVRRSREARAMARRTDFGRELLAGQWAVAEFGALSTLWSLGAPVPYPVQLHGVEVMLEFVGDRATGQAAPRLAQVRPSDAEVRDLYGQCVEAMTILARGGWAHGDLSPYNLLVDDGRLVMIDLPQIVDVAANPRGAEYLQRDCVNVCTWFTRRGHPDADADLLFGDLMAEAVASW